MLFLLAGIAIVCAMVSVLVGVMFGWWPGVLGWSILIAAGCLAIALICVLIVRRLATSEARSGLRP